MPRRGNAEQRITQIADAANHVFGRLGYRRTHMADVATEAGLSSGASTCTWRARKRSPSGVRASLRTPRGPCPGVAARRPAARRHPEADRRRAARFGPQPRCCAWHWPMPRRLMRARRARGIVGERYRMIERLWPVLAVIERCAVDVPELEDMYFRRGRRGHIGGRSAATSSNGARAGMPRCPTRRLPLASSLRRSPGSCGIDAVGIVTRALRRRDGAAHDRRIRLRRTIEP